MVYGMSNVSSDVLFGATAYATVDTVSDVMLGQA